MYRNCHNTESNHHTSARLTFASHNEWKIGGVILNSAVIKGKRAIAYFDILGFKEKVETLTIDELVDWYTKLINNTENYFVDEATSQIRRKDTCKRFIFSDSIFLIANEDTEQGFVELVTYAWRMMQIALAMNFPLRGAITYGDIYVEQSRNIFIGESIVNAATWENKQNWMGAVVDKSAMERYHSILKGNDVLSDVLRLLLPIYPVPMKNDTTENQFVINWRTNIISQHGIKALFKNNTHDKAVERKIENTLAFAKFVRDCGVAYFDDAKVPSPYRSIYIADHEPSKEQPVTNGDEY